MGLSTRDSELVQIMDAAWAAAAQKAGSWLACRPGCTQCCHGAFAIDALDAERLHSGMEALRISDPARAAAIASRAQAWLDEHGPAFPGDPETGVLGQSEAELERFEDFANDAVCPALDSATGLCDVYAWRPMTCRVFGLPVRMGEGDALGCCELCFTGATEQEIAACEMPLPHALEQELLDQIGSRAETVVAFALLGMGQAASAPR